MPSSCLNSAHSEQPPKSGFQKGPGSYTKHVTCSLSHVIEQLPLPFRSDNTVRSPPVTLHGGAHTLSHLFSEVFGGIAPKLRYTPSGRGVAPPLPQRPGVSQVKLPFKRCCVTRGCSSYTVTCRTTPCHLVPLLDLRGSKETTPINEKEVTSFGSCYPYRCQPQFIEGVRDAYNQRLSGAGKGQTWSQILGQHSPSIVAILLSGLLSKTLFPKANTENITT